MNRKPLGELSIDEVISRTQRTKYQQNEQEKQVRDLKLPDVEFDLDENEKIVHIKTETPFAPTLETTFINENEVLQMMRTYSS